MKNLFGFNFFLLDGKLYVVGPFLRKTIKEELVNKGRYYVNTMVLSTKLNIRKSTVSTEILNKLVRIYKYPDLDYYNLLKKFGVSWLRNLLSGLGWKDKDVNNYIHILEDNFIGDEVNKKINVKN